MISCINLLIIKFSLTRSPWSDERLDAIMPFSDCGMRYSLPYFTLSICSTVVAVISTALFPGGGNLDLPFCSRLLSRIFPDYPMRRLPLDKPSVFGSPPCLFTYTKLYNQYFFLSFFSPFIYAFSVFVFYSKLV